MAKKIKRRDAILLLGLGIFLFLLVSGTLTSLYNQFTGEAVDTDGDGMPDTWEIQYELDPNDASDANQDADGDGYTNLQEYQQGTNPILADYPEGDGVETKVYVTVYSDSTLLSDVEISLDKLPSYDPYYIAYTDNTGKATFTNIKTGDYALFVRIGDVWKGGDRITVREGTNRFIFRYYPDTDTWGVN